MITSPLPTAAAGHTNPLIEIFFDGAKNGVEAAVRQALADGISTDVRNESGLTALMVAAGHGHASCVQILLDGGSDVNARTEDGKSALTQASLYNRTNCVALLLDRDPDDRHIDAFGRNTLKIATVYGNKAYLERVEKRPATAGDLIAAVKSGDLAALNKAIAHKVPLNERDSTGMTALIHACKNGSSDILYPLLLAGPDLLLDNPLLSAVQNGNNRCVELFLHRIKLSTPKESILATVTAIDSVINKAKELANRTHMISMMERAKIDLCTKYPQDLGEFFSAAREGNLSALEGMVKLGVDVNIEDPLSGLTLLMTAAKNGKTDCVYALIKAGAKLNTSDKDGKTALIHATEAGDHPCVVALLKNQAHINSADNFRKTALVYAAEADSETCTLLLLTEGALFDTRSIADVARVLLRADLTDPRLKMAKEILTNLENSSRTIQATLKAIGIDISIQEITEMQLADDTRAPDLAFTYTLKYTYEQTQQILRALPPTAQKCLTPHFTAMNEIRFIIPKFSELVFETCEHLFNKEFKCTISLGLPFVEPVCDPNGSTVYEKEHILTWVNRYHTSPSTRTPLKTAQLIAMPKLKAYFDGVASALWKALPDDAKKSLETLEDYAQNNPLCPLPMRRELSQQIKALEKTALKEQREIALRAGRKVEEEEA